MHNAIGLFKFEGEKVSGLNSRFSYRHYLFHALRAGVLLVAKAPQNHRHANVHIKLKTRTIAEQLVTFVPQTNSAFVVYSFCLIVHFWLLSDLLTYVSCERSEPRTSQ